MTGHLYVTANNAERDAEAAARDAMIVGAGDIRGMLKHVAAGGTAVAKISDIAVGFHLPEGATIAFSDSCPKASDPVNGALRIQAEARTHQSSAEMLDLNEDFTAGRMMSRMYRPGALPVPEAVVMNITDTSIDTMNTEQARNRLHRAAADGVADIEIITEKDIVGIWAEARSVEETAPSGDDTTLPAKRAPLFDLTLNSGETAEETDMTEPTAALSQHWTAVYTDAGELLTTSMDYAEESVTDFVDDTATEVDHDQAMEDFRYTFDDNGTDILLDVFPTDDPAEALRLYREANPEDDTPAP
jgi:hypothetical protein